MSIFDKENLVDEMIEAVQSTSPADGEAEYQVAAPVSEVAPSEGGTTLPPAGPGDESSDIPKSGANDDGGTKKSAQIKSTNLVGYETLIVLDGNVQTTAYKNGLPPTITRIPETLKDEENYSSVDLLRYNLGKFFYRSPDKKFTFIDPSLSLGENNISTNLTIKNTTKDNFANIIKYNFASLNASSLAKTSSPTSIEYREQGNFSLTRTLGPDETYFPPDIESFKNFILRDNLYALGLGTSNPFGYDDHTFVFKHPYDKTTSDELGVVKVLYSDVKSHYNFYQKSYEASFTSPVDNELPLELYLPNFNVILAEKNNSINSAQLEDTNKISNDKNYSVHTTLDGRIEKNILRPLQKNDPAYSETSEGRSGNEYFEFWGKTFRRLSLEVTSNSNMKAASRKFENVIYPLESLKDNDISITKRSFPFYNEIKFNTDTNTQVADILKRSNLFDVLIAYYIDKQKEFKRFHTYQQKVALNNLDEPVESTIFPLTINGENYSICDFNQFVDQVINLFAGPQTPEEAVSEALQGLGPDVDPESPPSGGLAGYALRNALSNIQNRTISLGSEKSLDEEIDLLTMNPLDALIAKIKFLSLYNSVVKENSRTFKDIMRGRTCYSETLFYRIEKTDATGKFIQNFYVLNDSQLIDVELIDTQVVYGKQYNYTIHAIQFVIGNNYNYENLGATMDVIAGSQTPLTEVSAIVRVVNSMSAKLIELPYIMPKSTVVQESPPIAPIVDFVPFRNNDKQVLVLFQNGTGVQHARPEIVKKEDFEAVQKTSKDKDGNVTFKSEGDTTAFEMYRISEYTMPDGPKSLMDFGNPKLSKKVTLSTLDGTPSFLDRISPNTKFWYIFRSLDEKHNDTLEAMNFSNTTNIYQVQAINNEGAIYFTLNTFDKDYFFLRNKTLYGDTLPTKTFRKYLRVKPNFSQSIIDEDPQTGGINFDDPSITESVKDYVENVLYDDVRQIKLGVKEKSVFGFDENNSETDFNQFKIRIISKKTGKKVDIFTRFRKPILQK